MLARRDCGEAQPCGGLPVQTTPPARDSGWSCPEVEGLGWRSAGLAFLTYLEGRGKQLRSLPDQVSESRTEDAEAAEAEQGPCGRVMVQRAGGHFTTG